MASVTFLQIHLDLEYSSKGTGEGDRGGVFQQVKVGGFQQADIGQCLGEKQEFSV